MKNNIIKEYLNNFKKGNTYNLYIDSLRYNYSDTWITQKEWKNLAITCIENNNNILSSLEIMLDIDYDNYISYAIKIVDKHYQETKLPDTYYYYDLVAMFPEDNYIKKYIFEDYTYFLDEGTNNKYLRRSLINAKNIFFVKIYGEYLNQKITKNLDEYLKINNINKEMNNTGEYLEIEDLIYSLADLETVGLKFISESNILILKKISLEYLQKDKIFAYKLLNGYTPDLEKERGLWIADNLAYIAWSFKWYDILDYLKNEEWYWLFLFDENYGYEDYNNTNLLIWSQYLKNNKKLIERATFIMENNKDMKIDGVIALSRLLKN